MHYQASYASYLSANTATGPGGHGMVLPTPPSLLGASSAAAAAAAAAAGVSVGSVGRLSTTSPMTTTAIAPSSSVLSETLSPKPPNHISGRSESDSPLVSSTASDSEIDKPFGSRNATR